MARKKLSLAVELQPDGRPAAQQFPDPRKIGPQSLGRRVLPQIPSAQPTRMRHTTIPKRGSR
jgi:hypothetical protein